jgi:hypothetical protein
MAWLPDKSVCSHCLAARIAGPPVFRQQAVWMRLQMIIAGIIVMLNLKLLV